MINILFFSLVFLGIALSVYRLVKGETPFDRVVSMDVINVCIIGVLVVVSLTTANELYLDVAIVYSVLGFLETIVFAKFLEGRS